MNYKILLDQTANKLEDILIENNGIKLDTEDFGWENTRYFSDSFRIAHIERYSDRALEVLHFTAFPNVDCGDPIFGFDIICTEKKPLAAFLDLSPVSYRPESFIENNFKTKYPLPEWAQNIFSDHAIAIIPDEDELVSLCDVAVELFGYYVLGISDRTNPIEVVEKQNHYCEQQLKNERTYNVLKAKLGDERAKYFMTNILFPKVNLLEDNMLVESKQ